MNRFLGLVVVLLLVVGVRNGARAEPVDWCNTAPAAENSADSPISVTINPATRWQPRGGTVIVALTDTKAPVPAGDLVACVDWTVPTPTEATTRFRTARLMVRAPETSDKPNTLNLGILVPELPDAKFSSDDRRSQNGTAFGIVPLAHLRLLGVDEGRVLFDIDQKIGITSSYLSYIVAITVVVVAGLLIKSFAADPASPPTPGSCGWILDIIRAQDGTASLSSLQLLLWTLVVLASAAYVMTLSGMLIDLTNGTLELLGIAGGAKLTAAYKEASDAPPALLAKLATPQWSDVVRADKTNMLDITRIQMLLFTFVSAWFVLLQVLTTFVIPDIPPGYVILMGISNGIYAGRKVTT